MKNEEKAKKTYAKFQQEFHKNFSCITSGLVLNETVPHLGASPDGLIECDCCGKGCLEIKCLYKYEDGLPGPYFHGDDNYPPNFPKNGYMICKESEYPLDSEFTLKKSHKYFTQCQGHMMICDRSYCDLYLWSQKRSIAVRVIYYNSQRKINKGIHRIYSTKTDVNLRRNNRWQ